MRRFLILVVCSLPLSAQLISGNGFMGGPGTSVTNNPVSLVLERKQAQTLTDGTHISNTTHEYFYRDSLGRTRSETEFPMRVAGPEAPRMISVQDPVAGVMLYWQTGGAGNRHEYNRMATTPVPQSMPPHRSVGPVNAPPPETYHRIVEAPAVKWPETKNVDLGVLDVQGASCKASRSITTYPVDFFGNDRPMTVVQEQCRSSEFGRNLQEHSEDPRSGTRTVSVQSLSRGEPDPSLFQPPPGYTEHVQLSQQER